MIFRALSALLVMLTVISCRNDFIDDKIGGGRLPFDKDAQTFIMIRVYTTSGSDGGTRADNDFVDGDHEEHQIGLTGNYAIFFNVKEEFVNMVNLVPADLTHEEIGDEEVGGNVREAIFKAPYHITEEQYNKYWDENKLNETLGYCLVVLNGGSIGYKISEKAQVGNSIDDIINIIWDNQDSRKIGFANADGKNYFTMSNSAYVKDGRQIAAPFKVSAIQEVKVEDYNWDEAITVYVERLVAKVDFTVDLDTDHKYSSIEANTETKEIDGESKEVVTNYIFTPKNSDDISGLTPEEKLAINHQINLCTKWEHHNASHRYEYIEDGETKEATIETEYWDPVTENRGWRAVISGWDMNALEKKEYLFKNISTAYSFGNSWDWNKPDYFRTLWAEDPDYDDVTEYPWQYRKPVNIPDDYINNGINSIPDYSSNYDNDQNNSNLLQNFSYEKLNNGDFGRSVYIPENTYDHSELDVESLDGRRDLLAGTHLIVTGTLEYEDAKESGNYIVTDLYRNASGLYFDNAKDCVWSMVRDFNNALMSQKRMRFRQYDWKDQSNGKKLFGVPIEGQNGGGMYQVWYDGEPLTYDRIMKGLTEKDCRNLLMAANLKDGDGKNVLQSDKFTIQNAGGKHLPIYFRYNIGADDDTHELWDNSPYYLGTTKERKVVEGLDLLQSYSDQLDVLLEQLEKAQTDAAKAPIRAQMEEIRTLMRNRINSATTKNSESNNDVWSLIYEWSGAVDHFSDGKMYYATSLNLYQEGDDQLNANGNNIYGSVRNTWYKYTITDLKGIGIPVDNPNQPIVPNWDNFSDRVLLRINIFPWHNFNLGEFDISGIK